MRCIRRTLIFYFGAFSSPFSFTYLPFYLIYCNRLQPSSQPSSMVRWDHRVYDFTPLGSCRPVPWLQFITVDKSNIHCLPFIFLFSTQWTNSMHWNVAFRNAQQSGNTTHCPSISCLCISISRCLTFLLILKPSSQPSSMVRLKDCVSMFVVEFALLWSRVVEVSWWRSLLLSVNY